MNFSMKIYLCLYSVGGFACYVNQKGGRDKMNKDGLSTLSVSVTTHLYCSCSAAKMHSSFRKEGTQGHQLTDL